MRKILWLLVPGVLLSCKTPSAPEFAKIKDPTAKTLAAGVTVREVQFGGATYRVISVDTHVAQIKMLSHLSTNGEIHNFKSLNAKIPVVFAVNGGMFHRNKSPVGLYVEAGKIVTPIDLSNGTGNFYLKPNGVFALQGGTPVVTTSERFQGASEFATQSGPMLVIDGAIHPTFVKDSTNLNIRNGVAVTSGRYVHLAISLQPVRLYDFADFYKTVIGATDALYLDGHISQAFIPGISNPFPQQEFGVFIFVE